MLSLTYIEKVNIIILMENETSFDITEKIIEIQSETNMYNGEPLDVKRVEVLWELIQEENDSQLSLVKDQNLVQEWEDLKNKINRKLEAAENETQKILALSRVINLLSGSQQDSYNYKGYNGIKHGNCIHVREFDLV